MRYRLDGRVVFISDEDVLEPGEVIVEVINSKEYAQRYQEQIHHHVLSKSISHAQYCKADVLKECIVGTFVIPDKEDLLGKEFGFGFFLKKDRLVFVDDENRLEDMIVKLAETQVLEKTEVAHFLFEVMEYLVKDDVIFLQEYEARLADMEESLLENEIADFNQILLKIRRELLILNSYYQQLIDLSETLEENQNHIFCAEDCRLFSLYANRVSRLYANAQMLKEYSLQMREMYQAQIDIRQNQIMQFLTVVTTVFMPLTLIAGWYGMNFMNMPELRMKLGYPIVIGISILIILIEVWYFKVKKWFK